MTPMSDDSLSEPPSVTRRRVTGAYAVYARHQAPKAEAGDISEDVLAIHQRTSLCLLPLSPQGSPIPLTILQAVLPLLGVRRRV